MKRFYLLIILLISVFHFSSGQNAGSTSDSLLTAYIEETKSLLDKKEYKAAEDVLRKIVSLNLVVPDEMAYYFAVSQYGLERYAVSKNALEKYLSLAGKKGKFSREAFQLMNEINCLETGFYDSYEICDMCDGTGKETIACGNCKGKGRHLCNSCKGSGVSKENKSLGANYHSCQKCKGSGNIDCIQCHGAKTIVVACISCQGSGAIKVRKKCK